MYSVQGCHHTQELVGLRWDGWGERLATGGNDNRVYLWNTSALSVPNGRIDEHHAAVKAIAWSPHRRGLLATGGGTADRYIRIWNTMQSEINASPSPLSHFNTGSQVCNMAWSPQDPRCLISSQGFNDNLVVAWDYLRGGEPIAMMRGHEQRVLHMALGPDGGKTVATASADQTIRLWQPIRNQMNIRPRRLLDPNSSREGLDLEEFDRLVLL